MSAHVAEFLTANTIEDRILANYGAPAFGAPGVRYAPVNAESHGGVWFESWAFTYAADNGDTIIEFDREPWVTPIRGRHSER